MGGLSDEDLDLEEGKVQDYKFLGQLKSYDDKKQHGMISCAETHQLWGQEVYIHRSVMDTAKIGMNDYLRFGVHLNTRGQPQASLPVHKVGDDGQPVGVKGDERVIPVEEMVAMDETFLNQLGDMIKDRSNAQNDKQSRKRKFDDDKGKGKGDYGKGGYGKGGGDYGKGDYGKGGYGGGGGGWGGDPWGADPWAGGGGYGGGGGKAGGKGGVDLFVGGVPHDATKRELEHIFRQYAGFMSLRMVEKAQLLVFVTFATPAQAQFVAEALSGYVFDQDSRDQAVLSVQVSKGSGKGKKK